MHNEMNKTLSYNENFDQFHIKVLNLVTFLWLKNEMNQKVDFQESILTVPFSIRTRHFLTWNVVHNFKKPTLNFKNKSLIFNINF
jgi:hypothetical protein